MRCTSRLLALVLLTSSAAAAPSPPRCIHHRAAPPAELATDAQQDWRARLASGDAVTVVLTFKDSRSFDLETDPFGTLLGGTSYTLRVARGAFELTGFSESTQSVGTWTYRNARLADDRISLWGVVTRFDRTTGALSSGGQTIGYLR